MAGCVVPLPGFSERRNAGWTVRSLAAPWAAGRFSGRPLQKSGNQPQIRVPGCLRAYTGRIPRGYYAVGADRFGDS